MKLKISSFADAGNFQKERLVIKVESDTDIGDYAAFCSAISSEGKATSGRKNAYWFPDGDVKSGDLVVLYTKRGTASMKELEGGRTAHFYYWGQENSLWGSASNAAVILRVAEWTFKTPPQ